MSVAVVGDKIYAVAGLDRSLGDTNTTRIYDIASNTWSRGADAPGHDSEGAAVAHAGLMYVVGGRGEGLNALWAYDPTNDTWNSALSQLPTGRNGLAAAVVGNAIYAIGGRTCGSPACGWTLDVVERYDIDTDTWTTVAHLPERRSDLAAVTMGGKIYVFGGFDSNRMAVDSVDVYDPTTDSWNSGLASMPTARGAFYGAASIGNSVFLIGGCNNGSFAGCVTPLTTVESYSVAHDSWDAGLPAMPHGRGEAGVVSHGGRIYVVGGSTPAFGAAVAFNEVFKP